MTTTMETTGRRAIHAAVGVARPHPAARLRGVRLVAAVILGLLSILLIL